MILSVETTNAVAAYATQFAGAYYSHQVQNSAAEQAIAALETAGAIDENSDYTDPANWRDVIDMLALCGAALDDHGVLIFEDNSILAFDGDGVGLCFTH